MQLPCKFKEKQKQIKKTRECFLRGLVQTMFGKISVIVTLEGGGGVTLRKNLLSASIVL